MENRLLATLEDAIQSWMDKECGAADWPESWVYDTQVTDMANAAALVFDASIKAQRFAEEQTGDEE